MQTIFRMRIFGFVTSSGGLGPRRVEGHLKVAVNLKTSRMAVILKSISQRRKQFRERRGLAHGHTTG